mgnify:CR=1 FL=1
MDGNRHNLKKQDMEQILMNITKQENGHDIVVSVKIDEENKFAKVSKADTNTEKDTEFITALELLIDNYRKEQ